MRNIIEEFNRDENTFAYDTVKYCQEHKDEVKDTLLTEIDRFIANIKDYRGKKCEISIEYAIYLLAEFRDTRLCQRIFDIIFLGESEIFGDEGLDSIIASVFDGNYDNIDKVFKNPDIDVYTIYDVLKSYMYQYDNGSLSKEEVISYLNELIEYYNYNKEEFYTWIMDAIVDYKIFEMMDTVRVLYKRNLIDISILGGYDGFIDYIFDYKHIRKTKLIEDAIEEMSWWYCFNQKDDDNKGIEAKDIENFLKEDFKKVNKKVGRNDPCPCGSGKKYKYCCINKNTLPYQGYIDKSINRYPQKKENDNELDIYDFYTEDNIKIDKEMYKFLCHKAVPIMIKRDYKTENEMNVEICEKVVELLKEKLSKEHYETINEYDEKNSIHYGLLHFFVKYTETIFEGIDKYKKLNYVNNLEELLNLFFDNFNLTDENELVFIDRMTCLYSYKNKLNDCIKYLEEKVKTCVPNLKYEVYKILFNIIDKFYNQDINRINSYVDREEDKDLQERLKDFIDKEYCEYE